MTSNEIAALLYKNGVLYKGQQAPATSAELAIVAAEWQEQFRDIPGQIVEEAFHRAVSKSQFYIRPCQICEQLDAMAAGTKPSAELVWSGILKTVGKARKYIGWRACPMVVGIDESGKPVKSTGEAEIEDLYAELPESARLWLGGPSGLVDLARMGDAELTSYRRSEFLRYAREAPAERAADAARNLLPDKGAPVSGVFAVGTDVPRQLKRSGV